MINATSKDVEMVAMMTGRHFVPTDTMVPKFRENPRMITAHCRIFFEVNLIPVASLFEVEKFGFIKVTIIPIRMAKTGAPMISKEKPDTLKLENRVAIAAIIRHVRIPNPFFLKKVIVKPHNRIF